MYTCKISGSAICTRLGNQFLCLVYVFAYMCVFICRNFVLVCVCYMHTYWLLVCAYVLTRHVCMMVVIHMYLLAEIRPGVIQATMCVCCVLAYIHTRITYLHAYIYLCMACVHVVKWFKNTCTHDMYALRVLPCHWCLFFQCT